MLEFLSALILGIVQGITEFVPISSSGHLVILHDILPLKFSDELAFDVVLHFGTLLAVVFFFWVDIKNILNAWLRGGFKRNMPFEAKLGWYLIVATIPAAIAGYFLEDFIVSNLRSEFIVVIMLIVIAVLFLIIEKFASQKNSLEKLTWQNSLWIGLAQALALIPGTSRSGITIIAGLASKLKREAAVRFSFLLSLPIVLGANVKKIPAVAGIFSQENFILLLISFVISFVFGWLAIKYFLKFIRNHSLAIFAYYRILLAVVIILILYFTSGV